MKVTEFPQDPVEAYDQAERAALRRLGNRAIEAASTLVFDRIGYPTRVRSVGELWRYADVMHDGRARQHYDRLSGFTEREFALLSIGVRLGANVSGKLGRKIIPIDAPLMAVIPYRLITMCISSGAVFELGPGSGYLGNMLVADAFNYCSTDACQAFFLWQRHLDIGAQIPWWEWYDHERPDFKVDCVTANHVLNELHETALRYLVVRAERMLTEKGFLVVEDFGDQSVRGTQATKDVFLGRGWRECAGGYILVPPGGKFDTGAVEKSAKAPMRLERDWDDLVAVWRSLGSGPNPDAELAKFVNGDGSIIPTTPGGPSST